MIAILKKELRSYFLSPIGYVCMAFILCLFGVYYFAVLTYASSDLIPAVYSSMFLWCMLVIPVLTMRSFSEERRNKTDQALLTAPVKTSSIVLGKFLGAYSVFFFTMCVSLVPALVIGFVSKPNWALILSCFAGALLFGAAMTAIGMLISAVTESQVIAAVGTFGAAVGLIMINQLGSFINTPVMEKIVGWISFGSRYNEFTAGTFNISSVVFFLSITAAFLFLTVRKLESRRQSRHIVTSAALCAGILVVAVAVNVIFSVMGTRFPSMNIDVSKGQMNTLSEVATQVVDKVQKPTTIIIAENETAVNDDPTYRQVGMLAAKMAERNSNISVEYKELDKEPGIVAEYKADNIGARSVVVKTENRHRVLSYSGDLFPIDYQAQTQGNNVDGALASALNYVVADSLTVAAIDTGHALQAPADYTKLLTDNGYETADFNLMTDEIPENTQLLVLFAPGKDFTDEELTKLSGYLSSSAMEKDRSLLVMMDPSLGELPKLSAFLAEWGIGTQPAMVVEGDSNRYFSNTPAYFYATPSMELDLEGAGSYEYLAMLNSVPVDILFTSRGDRVTHPLISSSEQAHLYDLATQQEDTSAVNKYNLGVISQERLKDGQIANVAVIGSAVMSFAPYLNSPYSNGQYLMDIAHYMTGSVASSTAVISTTPEPAVQQDITLSSMMAGLLGLCVFTVLIPLGLIIAGIVVFLKRRHL